MKSSKIILPLLAAGVIVSFYYAWQDMQPVDPINKDTAGIKYTVDSTDSKAVGSVRFNFNGGKQRKFRRPSRNLFGQLFPAPPAPKVVVAPVVAPPPVVAAVAPISPPPMPVSIHTPGTQMPSFQVLGFLEKSGQLTAFLSLQGEIYLVKNKQVFAAEYRVAELNNERIKITRASGAGEVSLPLREKASPTPISGGTAVRAQSPQNRQVARPTLRPSILIVPPKNMPPAHPPIEVGN